VAVALPVVACAWWQTKPDDGEGADARSGERPFVDGDFPWDYYSSTEFRRVFEVALPEIESKALAGLADREYAWSWYKLLLMLNTPAAMPWPASIRWPEVDETVRHFACGAPRPWRRTSPLAEVCSKISYPESIRVLQPLADAMTSYLGSAVLLNPELTSDTGCWHCDAADVRVLSSLATRSGDRLLAELYVDFGFGEHSGNQTWIVGLREHGENWQLSRAWLEGVE